MVLRDYHIANQVSTDHLKHTRQPEKSDKYTQRSESPTNSFIPKDIQRSFHLVRTITLAESFKERGKNVASGSNEMLQYVD